MLLNIMKNDDFELVKDSFYSKNDLIKIGLVYIKETTITMFYRKEEVVYIFEAKPNKKQLYKYLCCIVD